MRIIDEDAERAPRDPELDEIPMPLGAPPGKVLPRKSYILES